MCPGPRPVLEVAPSGPDMPTESAPTAVARPPARPPARSARLYARPSILPPADSARLKPLTAIHVLYSAHISSVPIGTLCTASPLSLSLSLSLSCCACERTCVRVGACEPCVCSLWVRVRRSCGWVRAVSDGLLVCVVSPTSPSVRPVCEFQVGAFVSFFVECFN